MIFVLDGKFHTFRLFLDISSTKGEGPDLILEPLLEDGRLNKREQGRSGAERV